MNALETPRLVAIAGPLTGDVFALSDLEVTIGRDASNGIAIADRALSRRHCALTRDGASWSLRDLGSSNGTFVNGIQVSEQALDDGDRIKLGDSLLLFVRRYLVNGGPASNAQIIEDEAAGSTSQLRLEDAVYLRPDLHSARTGRVEQSLRTLLNVSTAITSLRKEDDLHPQLLTLLLDAVPADRAAVLLVDEDGAVSATYTPPSAGAPPIVISQPLLQQVLTDRIAILRTDAAVSQGVDAAGARQDSVGSLLCVPLVVRARPVGVIYLIAGATAFDDEHLQLVTAIASITSIALENVRHVRWLETETERLQADLRLEHNMVGRSPAIQRVYDQIALVARSEATVLLCGETGTGKELAARAIHLNSARSRRPFVSINCAALTETLLETELFGHERGAFTGAVAQKKGKLEVAEGGTVFLDEVGEMAPTLQSKLLRVLQEREFERVGGTRPIRADIRVIAATNRQLPAEVAAGRFREDLFYRLNVISIEMPALRERRDDIPLLATHFVARYARTAGRPVRGILPAAMKCLVSYDWPGNIRELQNAIERAVVLGCADQIRPEDLPDALVESGPIPVPGTPTIHAIVVEAKRRAIGEAFREARGSYTETAHLLGLHPNYLHRLIRNLGLKGALERES